jgi:transposase
MGTPVPVGVREAIVHAYHQQGLSYSQIAALLGIGQATVNRVLRLHRETGGVQPRPGGGGNLSPLRGAFAGFLETLIAELPDATVAELTKTLMSRAAVRTSRSSVQRALARLGYTRKKRPSSLRNATPPSTVGTAARSAR